MRIEESPASATERAYSGYVIVTARCCFVKSTRYHHAVAAALFAACLDVTREALRDCQKVLLKMLARRDDMNA